MLREAVLNQRNYVRLIAHSALHGLSYERTVGQFAATARLTELALKTAADEGEARDPDAPDPRFVIASVVAMLIGWSAAREWILRASDLEVMSDDEFTERFERIVVDHGAAVLPESPGGAGRVTGSRATGSSQRGEARPRSG